MHNIAQRHHHHHRQRRLVWWHEAAAAGGMVLLGFVCVVTALVSVYVCEYMCQSRNKESARDREIERGRQASARLWDDTPHTIALYTRIAYHLWTTCDLSVCECVFFRELEIMHCLACNTTHTRNATIDGSRKPINLIPHTGLCIQCMW